jgi:hypothetical protein
VHEHGFAADVAGIGGPVARLAVVYPFTMADLLV